MKRFGFAVAMLSFSSAAFAQIDETANADRRANDPNRIVCVKEEVIGSRLATRKRCLTASEWAETRRIERQAIERVQFAKRHAGE